MNTSPVNTAQSGAARNLTLEEIGRLAGVSRSTVSRVVNQHPDVRSEVRLRVEAVIAKTGYEPNQAARSLVSAKTGILGLVIAVEVADLFDDPYFSRLIHGVSQGCADAGLVLSIFPIYGAQDETRIFPNLAGGGMLDAVIVTAGPLSEGLIGRLRDRGAPFAVVGRPKDTDRVSYVDVTNRSGAADLVTHLIESGHRRIAHVGMSDQSTHGADRANGYRDALAAANIEVDHDLITIAESSFTGGAFGVDKVLPAKPDAVFFATDPMAAGGIKTLQLRGIDVPGDIAVAAFDGLADPSATTPSLTTMAQPVSDVGRRVVTAVLDHDPDNPLHLSLPTTLVVRESCGASNSK